MAGSPRLGRRAGKRLSPSGSKRLPHQRIGMNWSTNARLAIDTLAMKAAHGIPTWLVNLMEVSELEHFAGASAGDYVRDPEEVYTAFQKNIGACFIDQYIPRNPLSMQRNGYGHDTVRTATTGVEEVILDGIRIDSPEAVVEHMERIIFPALAERIRSHDADASVSAQALIDREKKTQDFFGAGMLKVPYGGEWGAFPYFRYGTYGYANYFMAYALYPEVIARDLSLQADLAEKNNAVSAQAVRRGNLPAVIRLDHDMADSRSTLVDIKTLDKMWFPQFARSVRPLLDAGIRLLWHCDGNLMQMVPRLIEAGVGGFQGFQYEDGMDYEKICRMRGGDGGPLMIWGGVSVTRTLPKGTADDVKKEMQWLVEHAPPVGFCLGASSSVAPGVKRENLRVFFGGLEYYRRHGRR